MRRDTDSMDEDELAEHRAAEAAQAQQRLTELRTEIATKAPDELRALIEQMDAEKATLTAALEASEQDRDDLMVRLEENVGVTESLDTQLQDARARVNKDLKTYPRMLYHRDGKTAVVQSRAGMLQLVRTGLWFDHPDKAEAARKKKYDLPEPDEIVDVKRSRLESMTPAERAEAIGGMVRQDANARPERDDSRIDVTIEFLGRPALPKAEH